MSSSSSFFWWQVVIFDEDVQPINFEVAVVITSDSVFNDTTDRHDCARGVGSTLRCSADEACHSGQG